MDQSDNRTAPINLQTKETQSNLIDRAVALLGKNHSDFIVDSEKFDAFSQALKAPLRDNPALQKLLTRKSSWE